jgi:hydrogenase-4 component B
MLIPQYLIITVMLSVSFLPWFYFKAINHLLNGLCHNLVMIEPAVFVKCSENLFSISIYSALFIGIIGIIWALRFLIIRNKIVKVEPTWGCSYLAPNSRMQYTGKSFSKPLAKIFNFLIIEKKQYQELKAGETFPEDRRYTSRYHDFFENRIVNTITQRLLYSMNYFKFIQNGRVQSYVLYGIVFILSIFILTFLDIIQ